MRRGARTTLVQQIQQQASEVQLPCPSPATAAGPYHPPLPPLPLKHSLPGLALLGALGVEVGPGAQAPAWAARAAPRRLVVQVTGAAVSMPTRIQRMDEFLQQVENGDIKLRVRVMEVRPRVSATWLIVKAPPGYLGRSGARQQGYPRHAERRCTDAACG